MIADVTQPWFFSGERAESISGRSRTLSGASPPKIQKKSGAKKTSVFSVLLCQNIQFFVAGAPEHFCWILGRLGFDSCLKVSTLFSQAKTRKMRISRVAHVAERYFSQAETKQILISTIADVTEPHFSFARTRKIEFQ